ncbi:hypothetical protein GWI33_002219 [Rhynchophorus ferrugineus]|uniref:Uncharacterized protein n=1 Tax=Rhynchophorus ferrugineus TaxID=354439 RepID=A0A834M1H1_RHYFE|nr:hypothetical protein GWI33_002219 [Rhynchophorus ferrugineus]
MAIEIPRIEFLPNTDDLTSICSIKTYKNIVRSFGAILPASSGVTETVVYVCREERQGRSADRSGVGDGKDRAWRSAIKIQEWTGRAALKEASFAG